MLVVMKRDATTAEIDAVVARVGELGLTAIPLPGAERTAIGTFGVAARESGEQLESMPGVQEIVYVSRPFKLSSREVRAQDTVVRIGDVEIGAGRPLAVMAGPCSVETREQTIATAVAVRDAGATILRGGAYKPSTSPYSFRGLGEPGLAILEEAGRTTGLPVVTEVLTPADVGLVARHAQCLQIGTRNMQNFALLDAVGETRMPVLLKRGMSATIEELLLSAEYILAKGNPHVVLCERGIRTFEKYTRNTFDVSAIPLLKKLSHLPVIADPSHGTGKWYLVAPVALAAVAAGVDGLIVEVHPSPDHALKDGFQSLSFENFAALMRTVPAVAAAVGRRTAPSSPRSADRDLARSSVATRPGAPTPGAEGGALPRPRSERL
jgi:3-deoxy-7-phosphoheptulonate synthase